MIDLIICVAIGIALYAGYKRGIIRQAGSLVGLIVAVIASRLLGSPLGQLIASWGGERFSSPDGQLIAIAAGHILIFFIAWWAIGLLAGTLHDLVKALRLGILDSLLGSLMMALKVLIVASLLLNLWTMGHDSATANDIGGPIAQATAAFAPDLLGYVEANF